MSCPLLRRQTRQFPPRDNGDVRIDKLLLTTINQHRQARLGTGEHTPLFQCSQEIRGNGLAGLYLDRLLAHAWTNCQFNLQNVRDS